MSRGEIEVRLPVCDFGDGRHKSPRQAEVQGQVRRDAPIILNIGTKKLPATAGFGALESLIVESKLGNPRRKSAALSPVPAYHAERSRAPEAGENPETILEGVGRDVHLIGADLTADADVMLAANHVEGIGDREDVGSALEWGEAAISEGPVTAAHTGGGQSATDATQIRVRNAKLLRLTTVAAERIDLVEDAVKTDVDLVDGAVRKDVCFGDRGVSP